MTEKFEITKDTIEKILSEKSMEFTLAEIEELMNSEVEKPEDEMDTELVDMCAEILAKAYNPDFKAEKPAQIYRPWEHEAEAEASQPQPATKKRVVPFKRLLVAAAILVVVLVFALPAGAQLFDNKFSDGVIEFYDDFFHIDLNKDEPSADDSPINDTVSNMIINSLDNFMLPEVLRGAEYEKYGRMKQDEYMTTFYIDVNNEAAQISGQIMITQYNDASHAMTNGYGNVSDMYDYFKQLSLDFTDVVVFSNKGNSHIDYIYDNTDINIILDCDFEQAVSIAETINVKG